MIDKAAGFLLSSKTHEIDPASTMGEFGVTADETESPPPVPTKNQVTKSKKKKKEEAAVGDAIMACADAMSQGMEKLADSVIEMGAYMRPDPALVEGERWKLLDQLESKIAALEAKGGAGIKLDRLRRLLDRKEQEMFGDN